MLAAFDGAAYNVLLVAHILCAIIGFGALLLSVVYDLQARKHPGAGALAIAEANATVSKIAEYFIYAVLVFGIALVGVGHPVVKFGQTWVWLSIVLYIALIGLIHGGLNPRLRGIRANARELVAAMEGGGPPPEGFDFPQRVQQIQKLGKQAGVVRVGIDVIVIVILALMVAKPGF